MKYPLAIKKAIHGSKYYINRMLAQDAIQLDWYKGLNNFGDILNPILVNFISKRQILNVRSRYCSSEHLLAIGSILDRANNHSVVWGSGYISEQSKFIKPPAAIHAVRGKLTRKSLLDQGVDCPEIYGDPALLLPEFYQPDTQKKYKLGILPHYVDKASPYLKQFSDTVKIIDIQNPNPLAVIDQIIECEYLASSSLHGIIIADAYHIPNVWVKLSDKVTGGHFKFNDYFSSIETPTEVPYVLTNNTRPEDLITRSKNRDLNIDLNLLIDHFPEQFK